MSTPAMRSPIAKAIPFAEGSTETLMLASLAATERIAFVFPGQGSQYVGMGKSLYEASEAARQVFHQADQVLGFALTKLMFEGPERELMLTESRGRLLGTVYHLVRREDVPAYEEALKEESRVTASGPWPPYAFAPGLGT